MKALKFESFSNRIICHGPRHEKTGTILSRTIQGILSFIFNVHLIYLNMKYQSVAGANPQYRNTATDHYTTTVYHNTTNTKHTDNSGSEKSPLTTGEILDILYRLIPACLNIPYTDSGVSGLPSAVKYTVHLP